MRRRGVWIALLALAALAVVLVLVLGGSSATHPGPFYAPPAKLPAGPAGTIIRSEQVPELYVGADAYRVLYKSVGPEGEPAAVSGLILFPHGAAPHAPRPVLAFAHGDVGVESECAPSLQRRDLAQVIQGLGGFLAAGYAVAATDYAGLGMPGPNPYLSGRIAAANVLDSVRAADRLKAAHAGTAYAVWGPSQGGQAALFAGQIAAAYAPALALKGVAAGAPLGDPQLLVAAAARDPEARILAAMGLSAWSRLRPGADIEALLGASGASQVQQIAGHCLYGGTLEDAIPSSLVEGLKLVQPPWRTPPWNDIRAQAIPGGVSTPVPILIAQGTGDHVVLPAQTSALADRLCGLGDRVELRYYQSLGHREAGIVVAPDVAAWVDARFEGRLAGENCALIARQQAEARARAERERRRLQRERAAAHSRARRRGAG